MIASPSIQISAFLRKNPPRSISYVRVLHFISFSLCPFAREELLRELCHCAGEQEQGDEVRDAHQAVEGVGDAPQQAQIHRRAQNGHEGVDHEEGADHLVGVEQELDAPGAVEAPADDG